MNARKGKGSFARLFSAHLASCKFITFTLTIIRKGKYYFIYVYNLNFFDEIKKDKNLHRGKEKTKK